MDLSWLGRRLGPLPEAADKLQQLKRLVDDTVASVRRISYELRPPILDDLGPAAAIRWLAEDFAARTGIGVTTRLDEKGAAAPGDLGVAVFRIVQESLTNVARHAGAASVAITLAYADGRLVVRVSDSRSSA